MKRVSLVLLMLCLCFGASLADSINCFMPDQMAEGMNEILPLVARSLFDEYSSDIRSVTDYLSVTYTETQNQVVYYNNEDWRVELSFFFDGTAGIKKTSDSVNLVISRDLYDEQIQMILYAFAVAVSYDNPYMDQDTIIDYLMGATAESSALETSIGYLACVSSDTAYHYVLYKDDSFSYSGYSDDYSYGQSLLSSRNVSIELTGITPYASKYYPAALELYVHVINQTRKTIYVEIQDATVDGTPVTGLGIFDIEPGVVRDDEYLLLNGETQSGITAICNASEARLTLVVRESGTKKEIARNRVTISLYNVPRFTPYPISLANTPVPSGLSTGLYSPGSTAQIRSLSFSDTLWAEWDFKSGDRLSIRFEMKAAPGKKVRAFELYLYATDAWGNRVYGKNQIYTATTTKTISPGRTAYSDYIIIPKQSQIDQVFCGIKRVELSDGSVEEVPDSKVDYYQWTIE